jgi:hypothetical protein
MPRQAAGSLPLLNKQPKMLINARLCRSATLSMAYAGALFTDALLRAGKGLRVLSSAEK